MSAASDYIARMRQVASVKTFDDFRKLVDTNGWSIAEVIGEVEPSRTILQAMQTIGLSRWERFAEKLRTIDVTGAPVCRRIA